MDKQQKSPQGAELNDKQKRLLGILTETPNITEAAGLAGIGRSTAQRWLKEPVFKEQLESLRKEAMKEAMNSVHSHTAKAVEVLVRLMDSPNEWLQRQVAIDILNRSLMKSRFLSATGCRTGRKSKSRH